MIQAIQNYFLFIYFFWLNNFISDNANINISHININSWYKIPSLMDYLQINILTSFLDISGFYLEMWFNYPYDKKCIQNNIGCPQSDIIQCDHPENVN